MSGGRRTKQTVAHCCLSVDACGDAAPTNTTGRVSAAPPPRGHCPPSTSSCSHNRLLHAAQMLPHPGRHLGDEACPPGVWTDLTKGRLARTDKVLLALALARVCGAQQQDILGLRLSLSGSSSPPPSSLPLLPLFSHSLSLHLGQLSSVAE